MDASTWQIVATVVAGLLMALAAFGTVFPILPGSMLALATLLVWALVIGSAPAWTVAIIGAVIVIIGMSASYVLTGRRLVREKIPKGPILVGVVGAIIGMFLIPVLGLFLGFAVGLLLAEWQRRRDFRAALDASVGAMKTMGVGMLVELACVCLAGSAYFIGALVHFLR